MFILFETQTYDDSVDLVIEMEKNFEFAHEVGRLYCMEHLRWNNSSKKLSPGRKFWQKFSVVFFIFAGEFSIIKTFANKQSEMIY